MFFSVISVGDWRIAVPPSRSVFGLPLQTIHMSALLIQETVQMDGLTLQLVDSIAKLVELAGQLPILLGQLTVAPLDLVQPFLQPIDMVVEFLDTGRGPIAD